MAAIRLEDLLQAQQDLKKKDEKQQQVESMSIEEFRLMSKELSDTTSPKTTKSLIKKGMLDKTGEGLNSNVLKLTKVIKDASLQKGNIIGGKTPSIVNPVINDPVGSSSRDIEKARTESASKEGASKYINTENTQKGGFGFLKDEFKKLFTLRGIFDVEKTTDGIFGSSVLKKDKSNQIAAETKKQEDQYVSDQKTLDPKGKNKKQFGGDEKKFDDYNREQFKKQQEVAKKQADNEKKIEDLQSRGATDKELKKSGLLKIRTGMDNDRAKVDKRYSDQRKEDRATPVKDNTANNTAAELSTNETEAEAARAGGAQVGILSAIEVNTREMKEAITGLSKLGGGAAAAPAQGSGMLDLVGGGLKRAAGSVLGKVGGFAKGAISRGGSLLSTVASKATPLLSTAGSAIAEGASSLATKATPLLSTAGGTAAGGGGMLSKAGGLAKGILGKAALPLAAGMALYDGVSGYQDAKDNLDIKDREATMGEKLSSAGGSLVSGLSFGLLDKKDTSKGIANFFGAGPSTKAGATPATAAASPPPAGADVVYNKSGDNATAASKPAPISSAPVVINAPTTVSNTSNMAVNSPTRNTESSYRSYERSKFAMS